VSVRLLRCLLLLALMLAPSGRMGVAEAMTRHNAPTASHCAGQSMPKQGKGHRMAFDCMIACAAIATAPAPFALSRPLPEAMPSAAPVPILSGIRPEADPPPPRRA
jgi:hypothetical protein